MDTQPAIPPAAPAASAASPELLRVVELLTELRDLHLFNDKPLLTAQEAADWLGLSLRSMSRSESAGTFPAAVESPSGARWRKSDILKWAAELPPRRKKGRRFPTRIKVVKDYRD